MKDIVPSNDRSLMESWVKAEVEGNQFPVPFDALYKMAGYSRKDAAKRSLEALEDEDEAFFHTIVEKSKGRGRPKQTIMLSVECAKHFCLMAQTPQGKATRKYFIHCEKVLKQVQAIAPEVVNKAEELVLQRDVLELELRLMEKREYIVRTLPEPMQRKILGYQVVKEVEYRDRTITPDGEKLDGIGITYIAQRFGFGKNTQKAWKWLDSIGYGKDSGKWKLELSAVEAHKLPSEVLNELDELADSGDRQRWIGE